MNVDRLNSLSLCSGGGGLDLGLSLAVPALRTVCWVEWEAFACEVLAARMEAKQVVEAPVWSDLRTFDGRPWRGVVDILSAGYPCQPFSLAGKRRGSDDPRHLWPHVRRVVGEVEPAICFFENVSGHLSLGFDQVAADLKGMGYTVAAGLFTAAEVGASHKRERLFILAVDDSDASVTSDHPHTRFGVATECANPRLDERISGGTAETILPLFPPPPMDAERWRTALALAPECCPGEFQFPPLANGVALESLLGNGVVPLQAAYAFCSLWAALRLDQPDPFATVN